MGQVTLPGRLNFQTNPKDLAFQGALSHILYPQRIPTPYFYPKSPYSMKGLGDTCLPYDFYALQQTFGVTDCTVAPYSSDPATQYACQQKNAPLLAQIAQLSPSYGTCITPSMLPGPYTPAPLADAGNNPYLNPFSGPGLLYNPANPATPSSSPQYVGLSPGIVVPIGGSSFPVSTSPITYNPPASIPSGTSPPSTPAGSYRPVVTFTPSRQGLLYPGDTWSIVISGGAPRSPVSVYGGANGSYTTNSMGVTDQNGNFQLQGTIDNTMYGQAWQETWSVGGQNAGSFSFSVSQAPSGNTGSTQQGGSQPPSGGTGSGSSGGSGTGQQTGSGTGTTSTDWIPGVSNTMVMAGGGAILLLVLLGGRR